MRLVWWPREPCPQKRNQYPKRKSHEAPTLGPCTQPKCQQRSAEGSTLKASPGHRQQLAARHTSRSWGLPLLCTDPAPSVAQLHLASNPRGAHRGRCFLQNWHPLQNAASSETLGLACCRNLPLEHRCLCGVSRCLQKGSPGVPEPSKQKRVTPDPTPPPATPLAVPTWFRIGAGARQFKFLNALYQFLLGLEKTSHIEVVGPRDMADEELV